MTYIRVTSRFAPAISGEPVPMSSLRPPQNQARDLLQSAQAACYRFPNTFKGFRAAIAYSTTQGSSATWIEAHPPDRIKICSGNKTLGNKHKHLEKQAPVWLLPELTAVISRRWQDPLSDRLAPYPPAFVDHLPINCPMPPAGRRIRLTGDPSATVFSVSNNCVRQIDITGPTIRNIITILRYETTRDGHLLPVHYAEQHWHRNCGRLTASVLYTNHFVEIQGVMLPKARQAVISTDRGQDIRHIFFDHHTPLTESNDLSSHGSCQQTDQDPHDQDNPTHQDNQQGAKENLLFRLLHNNIDYRDTSEYIQKPITNNKNTPTKKRSFHEFGIFPIARFPFPSSS